MYINKNLPEISIIVPIYNVELYLEQCLDSLIHQTYTNIQIILVDDGSKDGSSEICDKYAEKDNRINVIHKQNGGLSSARKVGIEQAKGDYILIVDGDDWIDINTCEKCVEVARKDNSDCVMFGYIREHSKRSILNPLFSKDYFWEKEEAEEKIHRRIVGMNEWELCHPEKIDNLSSVCMKLYRTEVAKKGRIVDERVVGTSEDTIFNLYALEQCNISYINECFYHYRKTNEQSITAKHKEGLPEKWDILYQIFEEYMIDKEIKEKYYPYFLNRVACGTIGLGLNEISGDADFFIKVRRIKNVLKRSLYREAFSKINVQYCPFKWKVFFFLCRKRLSVMLTCLLMIINYLRYKAVE